MTFEDGTWFEVNDDCFNMGCHNCGQTETETHWTSVRNWLRRHTC